jgi:hypothetical protein
MTHARSEEIPVWQEAIRLAEAVYDLIRKRRPGISSGSCWTSFRRGIR